MVVMGEAGRFDPSRFIWMICQLFGDRPANAAKDPIKAVRVILTSATHMLFDCRPAREARRGQTGPSTSYIKH